MRFVRGFVSDYDLRHYIRPGDEITYESMKDCRSVTELQRHEPIIVTHRVVSVYRDFCITQLGKGLDGANRWNIRKLNGRDFELRKEAVYVDLN